MTSPFNLILFFSLTISWNKVFILIQVFQTKLLLVLVVLLVLSVSTGLAKTKTHHYVEPT